MKSTYLLTKPYKVILASSSKTRRMYIKKFIKEVKIVVFPLPKKPVKTVIDIFFGKEDIISYKLFALKLLILLCYNITNKIITVSK